MDSRRRANSKKPGGLDPRGVPSTVKEPENVDMVIFRENTEDVYAGIEWPTGLENAKKVIGLPRQGGPARQRHRHQARLDLPLHATLVRAPALYLECGRKSITLVHKGEIMKFTEDIFRDWATGGDAQRVR